MTETLNLTTKELAPKYELGDQLAKILKGVKIEKLGTENKSQREIMKLEVTDREKWIESLPSEAMLESLGAGFWAKRSGS